jgi:hypothetical protein
VPIEKKGYIILKNLILPNFKNFAKYKDELAFYPKQTFDKNGNFGDF